MSSGQNSPIDLKLSCPDRKITNSACCCTHQESGAADFTLADSVQIGIVTTNTQAYLQLDFFGTTDTTIPEPGVLAILGLASWVSVSRGDAAAEPHNDLLTQKRRPSGHSFSFWGLAFSVLPEVSFPHDQ